MENGNEESSHVSPDEGSNPRDGRILSACAAPRQNGAHASLSSCHFAGRVNLRPQSARTAIFIYKGEERW